MHRTARLALILVAGACVAVGLSFAAVETMFVQPAVAKARAAIALAKESERTPPQALARVLAKLPGQSMSSQAARLLPSLPPVQLQGVSNLRRQFGELALQRLLPLHLSEQELMALFLSQANMGQGVRGFAQAAQQHLGVELGRVNELQAAQLVAVSHAPSHYLASPERLSKRAQAILEAAAQ